jgi:hypothetical protein
MGSFVTTEEQRLMDRVADEPFYWIRKNVPEVKNWEDEFSDLVDHIKDVWDKCRITRINLCFIIKWTLSPRTSYTQSIDDYLALQKRQNDVGSTLIFEIDLNANIVDEIDTRREIETTSVRLLSQSRNAVVFWLGPDMDIFCSGVPWNPQNKLEVLRDIKSRRRDRLLSMENHRDVLQIHYEQYLLRSGVNYWFEGRKNEVLVAKPERRFQDSLYIFLRDSVDGVVDLEPMFKDYSRCDVRVLLDNLDLFFIEIKWIGYCAGKVRGKSVISAEKVSEFSVNKAIAGARQTKIYVDKNNSIQYENRIKMGILVVYDAYPVSKPIRYPKEIRIHPLLDTLQFPLVTNPPSVVSKIRSRRKRTGAHSATKPKKSRGKSSSKSKRAS